MSFEDCVNRAMNDPEVAADRERGERATRLWRDLADRYEADGYSRHIAEALAAQDVKEGMRREAGDKRHVLLSQIAATRRSAALVAQTDRLGTLMTDALEHAANSSNRGASVVGVQRGLMRRFHKSLGEVVSQHSRDMLQRVRNPAQLRNILAELHGESTGDAAAFALADAVRNAFEDMRLMFNEAGGVISKLENWGLPHTHNKAAIRAAGFEPWASEVAPRLAWHKIDDELTGRPLAALGRLPSETTQRAFLREAFDNIAFGRQLEQSEGLVSAGMSLWRRRAQERVLPFRTADDWIAYNIKFGTGDPFASIIGHAHRMARDIAMMREFGPDPRAGFQSRARLAMERARKEGDVQLARKIEGSAVHGERMLNILNGSLIPSGPFGEALASFMSTTRHVLTAASLDRAVLSVPSDLNSMRMAAKAIGLHPANVLSRHVKLLASSMDRAEAARAGWIADTLADPGLALARFQSEVPPAVFAERMSSFVLRAQGLNHWTDQARIAFQMEIAGLFAANSGKRLAEVAEPLRGLLKDKRITDAEWADFTSASTMFTTTNGASFASPIYWRDATKLPRRAADDLFARLQAIVEEQTEIAVPTGSTWARAHIEGTSPPGSIGYELSKSGMMFKSFPLTFTTNQIRRILSIPAGKGRVAYAVDMAAGATLMGAVSLQLLEIATGNDPRAMDRPSFWGQAALRSGAFGVLGDAMAASQSGLSGLASYAAGPGLGLAQDVANLTVGNAMQAVAGDETHITKEALQFLNRYAPGGDLPVVGAALDRMFFERLLLLLDPESLDAITAAAQKRQKEIGNEAFWLPGDFVPTRLPKLRSALGN